MRARVRVGVTSRCSTGPIRSGLIENSIESSSSFAARLLVGRELQQLLGIDGDRVGLDRRRGGDRCGDDAGLGCQALRSRRDDVGAKLVEQQEADDQDQQAAEIEEDDAAGQRRGKLERRAPEGGSRWRARERRHRALVGGQDGSLWASLLIAARGPFAPRPGPLRRHASGSGSRRVERFDHFDSAPPP